MLALKGARAIRPIANFLLVLAATLLVVGGCSSSDSAPASKPSGDCIAKTCAELGAQCGAADDGCGQSLFCGLCDGSDACVAGQCQCTPLTCADAGAECGDVPDGCGGVLSCGTCKSGVCGGGGPNRCGGTQCQPQTCAELGAQCGVLSDGCSGTVDCGGCSGQSKCSPTHQCSCAPSSCLDLGATCGSVPDGCGKTLDCGACAPPETCGSDNSCACKPTTCAAEGATCGSIPDGCGGSLDCGSCTAPEVCGGGGKNTCGSVPCETKTCTEQGAECGTVSDGCAGVLSCGSCAGSETCGGAGKPNECGCAPKTCAALGSECGSVSDGCGGTLDCGTCTAPETCGGAGQQNVCGCTPTTCTAAGAQCGSIPDGCGGTLDCGTCTAPETCGGAGQQNVCGCTPTSCTAAGAQCGSLSDGCGGTLSCGTCTAPETCSNNVCGCTSKVCLSYNCGSFPDGCGGTLNCGGCTAPKTCGGDGRDNVCGCTRTSCSAQGATCGYVSDGCGGNLDCGTCRTNFECTSQHTCVCEAGYHQCGYNCISDTSTSITSCGTSCAPCPTAANATTTCDGTSCDFECNPGFHRCGAAQCCPWVTSILKGGSGAFADESVIGVDPQGNPRIGYNDFNTPGGDAILTALASGSWSETTLSSSSTFTWGGRYISMAMNGSAANLAYWDAPNRLIHVAVDSSVTKATITTIPTFGGEEIMRPWTALAMDSGVPWVLWSSHRGDTSKTLIHLSHPVTGTWTTELVQTLGEGDSGELAIAGSRTHITFYDNAAGAQYAFRTASGSWTVEHPSNTDGRAYKLAIDSSGDPHLAFVLGGVLQHAQRSAAGVWTVEAIPGTSASAILHAIAVDTAGNVHIVYVPSGGVARPLMYALKAFGKWNIETISAGLPDRASSLGTVDLALFGETPHVSFRTADELLGYATVN